MIKDRTPVTCSICKAVDIHWNMLHVSCSAASFSFCDECSESEEWGGMIAQAGDDDAEFSSEGAWAIYHSLQYYHGSK